MTIQQDKEYNGTINRIAEMKAEQLKVEKKHQDALEDRLNKRIQSNKDKTIQYCTDSLIRTTKAMFKLFCTCILLIVILGIAFMIHLFGSYEPVEAMSINPQEGLKGHSVAEEPNTISNPLQYKGDFLITYYNGDGSHIEGGKNNCIGQPLRKGDIAVDKSVIPLNLRGKDVKVIAVWPDGSRDEFNPVDVGGDIKGQHIDVYLQGASQQELKSQEFTSAKIYVIER